MKRILMMIAIVLFIGTVGSAQDKTFNLTSTQFSDMTINIQDGSASGYLTSYPTKTIYTFSNTDPVELRMSVYIPCDSYGDGYASQIFGCKSNVEQVSSLGMLKSTRDSSNVSFVKEQISNSSLFQSAENAVSPVNLRNKSYIPYLKTLKSGEEKMVINAIDDKKSTEGLNLRSNSSLIIIPPIDYGDVYTANYLAPLETRKEWLKEDNAFSVWTSDKMSFETGENHVATFVWDGYSNLNGIRRLIDDQWVIYVLENANTGEILDVLYGDGSDIFGAYFNRAVATDGITDNWVATKDMPNISYYILSDGHCNFAPDESLINGVKGMLDFLGFECNNGVLAYATTGNDKNGKLIQAGIIEGAIRADTVSQLIWHPVAGPNNYSTTLPGGDYYIMTVAANSYDPNNYTVGKEFPVFGLYFGQRTFPDGFKLGAPAGIETIKTDEIKVVWKDNIPYIVINGQELKADAYDLTGKKVQIVENAKFYILQAQTADGRKYSQKVIR